MGASLGTLFGFGGNAGEERAMRHAPPTITGPVGISKNARKKLARGERLQERRAARKEQRRAEQARKKAVRREARDAVLDGMAPEEKERVLRERGDTMRAGRAEDRAKKARAKDLMLHGTRYAVCVDLGWNAHMYDKERKSLARQLAYSYSAMRKAAEEGLTPLALSITGVDDIMKPVLTTTASGWETWPVALSEKPLVEFHDTTKLVYLTHDASDVLEDLDPDAVYVVGGIVDRNRLKCATMKKAKELGVKTARLNLDANIALEHGTPVLTVNHCVEILLYAANGMSWKDAYLKVLPSRKGIRSTEAPCASDEQVAVVPEMEDVGKLYV